MKTLLITTALVAAVGGAALAQTASAPAAAPATTPATEHAARAHDGALSFVTTQAADDIRGSDLIGATIYAADYEGDAQGYFRREDASLDSIGSINDLVMSRDGEVKAVLVDVGGFLGIGAKTVAVDMAALNIVTESDDADDWRVLIDASREGLEAAPAFEDGERAMRDRAPMVRRDGWSRAEPTAMTAETLSGIEVFDVKDENIGSVADFVLTQDGGIDKVVLDVGGWLGMGVHRVAVPFDQVNILREREGDDFRAYVDVTEERLREMPSFER